MEFAMQVIAITAGLVIGHFIARAIDRKIEKKLR